MKKSLVNKHRVRKEASPVRPSSQISLSRVSLVETEQEPDHTSKPSSKVFSKPHLAVKVCSGLETGPSISHKDSEICTKLSKLLAEPTEPSVSSITRSYSQRSQVFDIDLIEAESFDPEQCIGLQLSAQRLSLLLSSSSERVFPIYD